MFREILRVIFVALIIHSGIYAKEQDSINKCKITFSSKLFENKTKLPLKYKTAERKTLNHFIESSINSINKAPYPSFYNFDQDVQISKTWSGTKGPNLLSSLLPEGITFIDHPLYASNMPGVVKTFGGEFISLRVNLPFKGNLNGTNIGIPRSALYDNAFRDNKSLVPAESKAVLIFMHGGGTTTTGHHVAANLMNHLHSYNIATISFDQIWHAEGLRTEEILTPKEYFEWIRDFIRTYISPSNVPIILSGHSFGGQLADMYARLYHNDDLVKGVIALSSVPDMRPGAIPRDRLFADDEILSGLTPENVTSEDLVMSASLLKQNKVSPLGGAFIEAIFGAHNDWAKPVGIKSLYIWGKYDWLHAGKEHLINKYVNSNENVTLKIYDERINVKGEKTRIGHLIFDHFRNNSDELETYADIRDFIANEILNGEKLRKVRRTNDNSGLIISIISTFANNLAFREFIKNHSFREKIIKDRNEMRFLSSMVVTLGKYVNSYKKMSKKKVPRYEEIPLPEDPITGQPLNLTKEEIFEEYRKLTNIMNNSYFPETSDGDLGRNFLELLEKTNAQYSILENRKKYLKTTLVEIKEKIKAIEIQLNFKLDFEQNSNHHIARLQKALLDTRSSLEELIEIDAKMSKETKQFISETLENKNTAFFPENLKNMAIEFGQATQKYQEENIKIKFIMQELALEGHFGGYLKEEASKLWGENSLYYQLNNFQEELETIEKQLLHYLDQSEDIKNLLILNYYNNLFDHEIIQAQDLFENNFLDWREHLNYFQKIWKNWQLLWGERVDDMAISLY